MSRRDLRRLARLLRWLVLSLSLVCLPALAAETDRIAIEQLPGETPLQTALAYVDACYRVGVIPSSVRPLQTFAHGNVPYVRLSLEGSPLVVRCAHALSKRHIVDGTIQWFDGFAGGEVLPGGDRIPDTEWIKAGTAVTPAAADESLVDALAQGSADARRKLAEAPLDAAMADIGTLIARGGPGPLAALEIVARTDPHWPVRVAAIDSIDPNLSLTVIMEAALHDPAWEVRLNAVTRLGGIASSLAPRASEAAGLLIRIAVQDTDWSVQRQAIWAMSTAVVRSGSSQLHTLMSGPSTDPRVVAAAMEALGGSRSIDHSDLVKFLNASAPEPRAIAAELLAAGVTSADDASLLWRGLNDTNRVVRLAAAPFLDRVDDDTIGPTLWTLYQAEASQMDASEEFERETLDAIARHPGGVHSASLEERLSRNDLSPNERRLLARALARLDPNAAERILAPQLGSPDLLTRIIAADAAPDSAGVHAHRLELLSDPNSDVRAATLIGLCRSASGPLTDILDKADLDPTPLAREAAAEVSHCGPHPEPHRLTTHLAGASGGNDPVSKAATPALAGIILLLASVLLDRLRRQP